jgi:hypothetical protein
LPLLPTTYQEPLFFPIQVLSFLFQLFVLSNLHFLIYPRPTQSLELLACTQSLQVVAEIFTKINFLHFKQESLDKQP